MTKVKKIKKYQFGGFMKGMIKSGVKKAVPKKAAFKITGDEMRQAFKSIERDEIKAMFKKIDAEDAAKEAAKKAAQKPAPKKKLGGKVKKAQKGDSLVYETPGTRYPKKRIAIDTAGYAGGKKVFKGTTKYMEDLAGNPKEYGEKSRKFGSRGVKSLLEFKAKKAAAAAPKKKAGGKIVKKKIVKK
jgi:hypothetical protein